MTTPGVPEVLSIVNELVNSVRPAVTVDSPMCQTTALLAMTPMTDYQLYISVLVFSEDIFGMQTEISHRSLKINFAGDFSELVKTIRAEMQPVSQHNFGSSIRFEIVL